jgi:hypothetical protein
VPGGTGRREAGSRTKPWNIKPLRPPASAW